MHCLLVPKKGGLNVDKNIFDIVVGVLWRLQAPVVRKLAMV